MQEHSPEAPALVRNDPHLEPFADQVRERGRRAAAMEQLLTGGRCSLAEFARGHEFFGLQRTPEGWVFREWAPNASAIHLVGEFSDWREEARFALAKDAPTGIWELRLPAEAIAPGNLYRLSVHWPGGQGERIPAYVRRVKQDPHTNIFSAEAYSPAQPHRWRIPRFQRTQEPIFIYEAHVGIATSEYRVGSFVEFEQAVLPRIRDAGYNTIQLMAIQEHPYYGSCGYHVSSLFAVSSRFGTPEELKHLIDAAHAAGIAVIMDLVHSHTVRNEVEGLSRFDGTLHQYFPEGPRGYHDLWDSRCFDYKRPEVLRFLLSNCRFWLEEYHFDGFRFDGVTSMLYEDHGAGRAFGPYEDYFDARINWDALTYLHLANQVVHAVNPDAVTVAEDVSGMPGLASPPAHGGVGFDYRLAMGTPDFWIKLVKERRDEDWDVPELWYELTNRRRDEKTVSYAESHDQALVGDQTLIFRLVGADMYDHMQVCDGNFRVERGVALHKLIRLVTLVTAGHGYLNFMGNEFGHPEWIDFPRDGNDWSYHHARRQWHLGDDPTLRYQQLRLFDHEMIALFRRHGILARGEPRLLEASVGDHVLCCERAGFVFVFNFHPSASFADYAFPAPSGKYLPVLDSDDPRFGGHARIAPDQEYFTQPRGPARRRVDLLSVYTPARTALVLQRVDGPEDASGRP